MKKNFIFLFLLFFFSLIGMAQGKNYQLSSHILDINVGKPAAGVKITLSKQDQSGAWVKVEEHFIAVGAL